MFDDLRSFNTVFPNNPFYNFLIYLLISRKLISLPANEYFPLSKDFIKKQIGAAGLKEIQEILKENIALGDDLFNPNKTPTIRKICKSSNVLDLKSLILQGLFKSVKSNEKNSKVLMKKHVKEVTLPTELQEEIANKKTALETVINLSPSPYCIHTLIIQTNQYNSNKKMNEITGIKTFLHAITKYGTPAILEFFLLLDDYFKSLIYSRNASRECLPLHYACSYNTVETIDIVLKNTLAKPEDVLNETEIGNYTAFQHACWKNTPSVVEFLLSKGANIKQVNNQTVLHLASINKHSGVIDILLKNGAGKFLHGQYENPLIWAVRYSNIGPHYFMNIGKLYAAGGRLSDDEKKNRPGASAEVFFLLAIYELTKNNYEDAEKFLQESGGCSTNKLRELLETNCNNKENNYGFTEQQLTALEKITAPFIQAKCSII